MIRYEMHELITVMSLTRTFKNRLNEHGLKLL